VTNDKLYIIDEQGVTIQVFEGGATQVTSINDDAPTLIKIYEPGQRGPKGDDGGQYVPPANIVSSSAQIASDISGSFVSASNYLSNRIGLIEAKSLFTSSQQVNFAEISGSFSTSSFLQNSFTASFNTFTASIEQKVQRLENATSSFLASSATSSLLTNQYSASADLRIGRLEAETSSYSLKLEISGAFASVSASLSGRLSAYDNKTLISGSAQVNYQQLQNIPSGILSSSNGFVSSSAQLSSDISGSSNALSASLAARVFSIEQTTGSVNAFTGSISNRLANIELTTGSLNIFTSSIQSEVNNLKNATSSYLTVSVLVPLNNYTGSVNSRLSSIESTTSSLNIHSASVDSRLERIESTTGSINLFTSSIQSEVNNLKTATSSYLSVSVLVPLNNYTGSSTTRFNSIESTTGSLNAVTASLQSQIDSLKLTSGSINAITASINTRLINIESRTGSYASTGSNTFVGNQTVTGSIIVSGSVHIVSGSISGSHIGDGSGLTGVVTASYAITASYALNGGGSSANVQTVGGRIFTYDSSIAPGSKGFRHIGHNCNIVKTRVISDTVGSIYINVKRFGTTIGTVFLSGQSSSIDTALTGWNTSLIQDDLLEFYVSQSSVNITNVTFFLDIQSI